MTECFLKKTFSDRHCYNHEYHSSNGRLSFYPSDPFCDYHFVCTCSAKTNNICAKKINGSHFQMFLFSFIELLNVRIAGKKTEYTPGWINYIPLGLWLFWRHPYICDSCHMWRRLSGSLRFHRSGPHGPIHLVLYLCYRNKHW